MYVSLSLSPSLACLHFTGPVSRCQTSHNSDAAIDAARYQKLVTDASHVSAVDPKTGPVPRSWQRLCSSNWMLPAAAVAVAAEAEG